MKIFSLDSPFHKYGTILFDLIVLSLLWFVLSGTFLFIPALMSDELITGLIPLIIMSFLMPTATAAVLNSVNHVFIKEDGYLMGSFFTIYRRKFLRCLGLGGVSLLLFSISAFNLWSVTYGPIELSFLGGIYLFIYAEYLMITTYASALLTETDMSVKKLMKYAFLLSNKHIAYSLGIFVPMIIIGLMLLETNNLLILIFGSGPSLWFIGWLLYTKVFDKYYLDKLA